MPVVAISPVLLEPAVFICHNVAGGKSGGGRLGKHLMSHLRLTKVPPMMSHPEETLP